MLRDHQSHTVNATIGDPNKFTPPHLNPFLAGLRLQKFSELEGDGTSLQGILVTNMTDTSAGALGGLMLGDVITMADNKPVHTISQLEKIAAAAHDELLIKVYRDTSSIYLVLQS